MAHGIAMEAMELPWELWVYHGNHAMVSIISSHDEILMTSLIGSQFVVVVFYGSRTF